MFGWELPPHYSGGLGIACNGLAKQLVNLGVNVTFVLPKKLAVEAEYMKIIFAQLQKNQKISTENYFVEKLLSSYIAPERYAELYQKLSYFSNADMFQSTLFDEVLHYSKFAGEIASKEPHDIIHAHEWLSFLCGVEAKKKSGKPLIVHVHATEFDRSGGGGVNQRVYEIEKMGMENADEVVAISHRMKNILVDKYGIRERKICVIHNGVDSSHMLNRGEASNKLKALKKGGNKIVLYAGRLTIQKGVDYFLQAAAKVLGHEKKVTFLVVGSGDMETQLIMQAAQLGISDKVIFTGWLKGAELFEAFSVADLYIMPSVSEPFGLIPLELMMLGKPVIISKQAGVSEAVSHALKVDFWDTEEMADKIMAVIKYSSLHKQLSEYGKDEVKKISWKEAALKCMSLYHKHCLQS